jgi:hypothetical protein
MLRNMPTEVSNGTNLTIWNSPIGNQSTVPPAQYAGGPPFVFLNLSGNGVADWSLKNWTSSAALSSPPQSHDHCGPFTNTTQLFATLQHRLSSRGINVDVDIPWFRCVPPEWVTLLLYRQGSDGLATSGSVTTVSAVNPNGFNALLGRTESIARVTPTGSNISTSPESAGFDVALSRLNMSLVYLNDTLFYLEFGAPLPTYSIEVDETLMVLLNSDAFICPLEVMWKQTPGGDSGAVLLGLVDVRSEPDPLVEFTRGMVQTTSVVSYATSLASPSGILDAQSLTVLGYMSCASPAQQRAVKNQRLLSLLSPSDDLAGIIIGNYYGILLFFGVQCVIMVIRRIWKKEPWRMCRAFARIPGTTLTIGVIGFQGTSLAAIKMMILRDNSTPELTALAASGIAVAILIPVLSVGLVWFFVNSSYTKYDYSDSKFEKYKKGIWPWLLPDGQWGPPKHTWAYGDMFKRIRRPSLVWCWYPLWSPVSIVVVGTYVPESAAGCSAQYAVMAALQLLFAGVLIKLKPFTDFPALCLCVVSHLVLCGLLAGLAANRGVDEGPLATAVLLLTNVVLVVSIMQAVVGVSRFVVHRTFVAGIPELHPPTVTRMSVTRRWRMYRETKAQKNAVKLRMERMRAAAAEDGVEALIDPSHGYDLSVAFLDMAPHSTNAFELDLVKRPKDISSANEKVEPSRKGRHDADVSNHADYDPLCQQDDGLVQSEPKPQRESETETTHYQRCSNDIDEEGSEMDSIDLNAPRAVYDEAASSTEEFSDV